MYELEEPFYNDLEPMPEQYEAIEKLIKDRCMDVAKDLVAQLDSSKKKVESQAQLIEKYIGIEREYNQLQKDTEQKFKEYSKKCAMEYLSNEAGLDGVVYGDTVYVVDYTTRKEDCSTCKGKKEISVSHNRENMAIRCPKCNGNGYMQECDYFVVPMRVVGFSCYAKDSEDGYYLKTDLSLSNGEKGRSGYPLVKDKRAEDLNSDNYYSGWYRTEEDAYKYCEKLKDTE